MIHQMRLSVVVVALRTFPKLAPQINKSTHNTSSGRKKQLKDKGLGRIFLGHQGPTRRDLPDKIFMQGAFFCSFRHGMAGMSRDLRREVPGSEKLYARNFGLICCSVLLSRVMLRSCFRINQAAASRWDPQSFIFTMASLCREPM